MRILRRHPVCAGIAATAFILGWPPASTSQAPYQHQVWTVENSGLPVNSATAITESKDGFLWIGTWQGLVRFDGTEFKVYNALSTPGLESHRIKFDLSLPGALALNSNFPNPFSAITTIRPARTRAASLTGHAQSCPWGASADSLYRM